MAKGVGQGAGVKGGQVVGGNDRGRKQGEGEALVVHPLPSRLFDVSLSIFNVS